jgi:low affinity Fe/Cu permease
LAIQAKLDDLILATAQAENSFIAAEQLSEEEIKHLRAMIIEKAGLRTGEETTTVHRTVSSVISAR